MADPKKKSTPYARLKAARAKHQDKKRLAAKAKSLKAAAIAKKCAEYDDHGETSTFLDSKHQEEQKEQTPKRRWQ